MFGVYSRITLKIDNRLCLTSMKDQYIIGLENNYTKG